MRFGTSVSLSGYLSEAGNLHRHRGGNRQFDLKVEADEKESTLKYDLAVDGDRLGAGKVKMGIGKRVANRSFLAAASSQLLGAASIAILATHPGSCVRLSLPALSL
jgi:hypothetical protein